MRIFFDTNFIVNLLVETDFSENAWKIVEKYADEDMITSISVVEETLFILKKLTKMPNAEIANKVQELLYGLKIQVIESLPLNEFIKVFSELDLLPNDALIAATCKHYGIRKIATFDEDFNRVDFLEVLEI
ncbi:MAG: PIN domain-containing protein [Archaeoglobaceae archaeon]